MRKELVMGMVLLLSFSLLLVSCQGPLAGKAVAPGGVCTISGEECTLGYNCISGTCQVDADGDGVATFQDECPTRGTLGQVSGYGCPSFSAVAPTA